MHMFVTLCECVHGLVCVCMCVNAYARKNELPFFPGCFVLKACVLFLTHMVLRAMARIEFSRSLLLGAC